MAYRAALPALWPAPSPPSRLRHSAGRFAGLPTSTHYFPAPPPRRGASAPTLRLPCALHRPTDWNTGLGGGPEHYRRARQFLLLGIQFYATYLHLTLVGQATWGGHLKTGTHTPGDTGGLTRTNHTTAAPRSGHRRKRAHLVGAHLQMACASASTHVQHHHLSLPARALLCLDSAGGRRTIPLQATIPLRRVCRTLQHTRNAHLYTCLPVLGCCLPAALHHALLPLPRTFH